MIYFPTKLRKVLAYTPVLCIYLMSKLQWKWK